MYQELLGNEAHKALPRLARMQRQSRLPVLPAAMLLSFGIRRRGGTDVKLDGVMHSERSMCDMVRIWRNPAMNLAESLCLEAFRDYQANHPGLLLHTLRTPLYSKGIL